MAKSSHLAWRWPVAKVWLRDLHYGLRAMWRRPAFAATVIATLATGVGATVTMFSFVDAILIRPLPYREPGRLVSLQEVRGSGVRTTGVAPGRLEDWNRLSTSFEAMAGSYSILVTESSEPVLRRMTAAYVSPRFFAVFAVPAVAGRVFSEDEEQFGGPAVAVISHSLWRQQFGLASNVLGRKLALLNQSFTIIGVMPPSFQYPEAATELWIPRQVDAGLMRIRAARMYRYSVGRLRPSATLDLARAELGNIQTRLGQQHPQTDSGWTVRMQPLQDTQTGSVKLALALSPPRCL